MLGAEAAYIGKTYFVFLPAYALNFVHTPWFRRSKASPATVMAVSLHPESADAAERGFEPSALPGPLVLRLAFAAALLVVLAGVVSGWLVARAWGQEALNQIVSQQTDEVEVVARSLASKIEQSQKVLRTVAASITPEMLDSPSYLEWLLHQGLPAVQFFDAIQVARRDGQLRIDLRYGQLDQPANLDPVERDILRRTLAQGKPMVSELISGCGGDGCVMLTMPLHAADGSVMGVVAGGLKLQSPALLPGAMALPERADSRMLVFTQEGTILLHSDATRVMGNVRDEPDLAPAYAQWRAQARALDGMGTTRVLPEHIVSMAAMPLPQWVVARVTDAHAALAPVRVAQQQVWWWVAGAAALCAASVAVLLLWLARPLARLCVRATWTEQAQPSPPLAWPRAGGEVGALARVLQALEQHRARSKTMEKHFQAVLEHAPLGIVIMRSGCVEVAGRQACQLLGYQPEQLRGHPVRDIYLSDTDYFDTGARMRASFAAHGTLTGDVRLKRKDGSPVWVRVQGRSVDISEPDAGTVWILEDLAASHALRQQNAGDPMHDALTQLTNRDGCLQRMQGLLSERQAATGASGEEAVGCGAFLHLDLSHFAVINDAAGHSAGDDVLCYVACLLETEVGQSGWVARLGGDTFGVALPRCSPAHAAMVAERLCAAVQAWEPVYEGRSYLLGVSIGLVVLDAYLDSAAAVLHAADMACYRAKRAGRNQVVVHQRAYATGEDGHAAAEI